MKGAKVAEFLNEFSGSVAQAKCILDENEARHFAVRSLQLFSLHFAIFRLLSISLPAVSVGKVFSLSQRYSRRVKEV